MRRMDLGSREKESIGDARLLTMTEWKLRITAHAERIGVQRSASAIKRMAQKVARDAQPGTDPDQVVAGLFEQRDEQPVTRANHLDPCDPRVKAIDYSDPTGEEASTNVDKERAA
jgi:hypothetical protein